MDNQTKNILIIEDNRKYSKLIQMNLQAAGYHVITSESGLQGLNATRQFKPDLILLDIMLPELDGHKISRLLKKDRQFKHIPILMLTSRDLDKDRYYATASNVEGYLLKTEPIEKILQKVKDSLNKNQSIGRFGLAHVR
ncbi:response regulator [bacterium]|nr:response regulator [bacterium]